MIEWNPKFELDSSEVDDEHHHLIDLVNQVLCDLGNPLFDSARNSAFESLIHFAREHFDSEERMMMGVGYVDAASHICQHGHLLKELESLWADMRSGRQLPDSNTATYLHFWMVDHILTFDKKLAAFLKATLPDGARSKPVDVRIPLPMLRAPRRRAP